MRDMIILHLRETYITIELLYHKQNRPANYRNQPNEAFESKAKFKTEMTMGTQ